ncbi:DUF3783 domain-containing protein [Intestinibacter bartlettii]|uniref:DUF3783 domain-containing protein n=1 Tax=Intestinibacter bartlettii TaxID=261299 RepID=A0ABS6DYB0_9FIRM|nr:DUF3783 domain-containing protein [Intestinibacter bartlettii]MBU5336226.1 DUF3783 domain-containing protein [Intestinibacter bartlettii]MDO5011657.1 DUF3783 domain-containing protein [Intestinibacter bartlettii]
MTFKKINENEQQNIHDRSCMILVNFNSKELAAIKTVSGFAGIRDRIAVTSKNGNTKIKDILDGNMVDDNEDVWSEKAIIFNNIPTNRVTGFLDGLKKMKIRRPLTAMVTEVSIDWKLNTLIYNLKEERKAIAKGQFVDHK